MERSLTLTPAYGRDYSSASKVREAWNANADFVISDIGSPSCGEYINKEDAIRGGISEVKIRYKKLANAVMVPVKALDS